MVHAHKVVFRTREAGVCISCYWDKHFSFTALVWVGRYCMHNGRWVGTTYLMVWSMYLAPTTLFSYILSSTHWQLIHTPQHHHLVPTPVIISLYSYRNSLGHTNLPKYTCKWHGSVQLVCGSFTRLHLPNYWFFWNKMYWLLESRWVGAQLINDRGQLFS